MIRNKRGDTIVEVMIAIVVLGAAIGGAFAITNKSQLATQANHERYQAQLYANQQAELLRQAYNNYIPTGTRSGFATSYTGPGCFDASAAFVTTCTNGIYTINTQLVNNGSSGAYDASITKLNYLITITWDKVGGGSSKLDLIYGV
jgi:Tfp pilus assembly protein PilV